MLKHCPRCRTDRRHTLVKRTGFLMQCAVALVSAAHGVNPSLVEHEFQCNACGHEHD